MFPHMSFHFIPKVSLSSTNSLLIQSWALQELFIAKNRQQISSDVSHIFKTFTESTPRTKRDAKENKR